MSGWLKSAPKKFKLMFVSLSGREYMVTLTAMGLVIDIPPFIAWERENEMIEADDTWFTSLHDLAISFGCVLGDVVSVEQVN